MRSRSCRKQVAGANNCGGGRGESNAEHADEHMDFNSTSQVWEQRGYKGRVIRAERGRRGGQTGANQTPVFSFSFWSLYGDVQRRWTPNSQRGQLDYKPEWGDGDGGHADDAADVAR